MFADPIRARLVREEAFRDSRGYLDQISELDLKSQDYLNQTPAYLAEANVKILIVQPIDKYTHKVFVDAYGETVAVIAFDALRNAETTEWLATSKSSSAQETERLYRHLTASIQNAAREHYRKFIEAYKDNGVEAEFTAIAGRRVDTDAYEVTVASNNDIIAVVQFTRINQQGALFWQKISSGAHGIDASVSYGKKEREVLEVARNYFYSKKIWPQKTYVRPSLYELKTKL